MFVRQCQILTKDYKMFLYSFLYWKGRILGWNFHPICQTLVHWISQLTEATEVGDGHDRHGPVQDVAVGVVGDHRADSVGQVRAEQGCK